MSKWQQARALMLPISAAILIPVLLLRVSRWKPPSRQSVLTVLPGVGFLVLGLSLFFQTVRLFNTVGEGTLAPWDAPKKLVVRGVYRRVRNPMITGVFCVIVGEALLLRSRALMGWAAVFALINAIYIPLLEEPGLVRRFGEDYERYRHHVPRWMPRHKAWHPLV